MNRISQRIHAPPHEIRYVPKIMNAVILAAAMIASVQSHIASVS
jgi:hypothetical protein